MSPPKNPKGIFFLLIYALLLNKTRHHHIEKIINRQRRLAHEALSRLHGKAPPKENEHPPMPEQQRLHPRRHHNSMHGFPV